MILTDTESRSRADLKKIGGRNYWEHASSEVLCAVFFDTDTGHLTTWEPGQPCPLKPSDRLAAHNMMGFDRFAFQRLGWRSAEDSTHVDTSELARMGGLPGALDALGTRWLGLPKDKVASRFTKGLSRPSRAKATHGQLPTIDASAAARVLAYCCSDVEILAEGWDQLSPWLDFLESDPEGEVSRVDRVINDRGVGFDVQLAQRLHEEDARLGEIAVGHVARQLRWSTEDVRRVAGSPEQLCEFAGLPNAQKETLVEAMAADALKPAARALCEVRQALASIARGKLEAGLARVSPDGRLRDTLRYYGAHTGRWSHRGMQLGNMARPSKRFDGWDDDAVCELTDLVLGGGHCDGEEIDMLIRACLVAREGHTFAEQDFSGVEARGLAWAAGDIEAIKILTSDLSPYKVMAGVIFGDDPRSISKGDPKYTIGKNAEVGCGYGMGASKFYLKYGKSLDALGVDPQVVIEAWRTLHKPIVRFWYALEGAFVRAAEGGECSVGPFTLNSADGGDTVVMWLPSGRPIVYNETRLGPGKFNRPSISYQGTKPNREHAYGGLLAENAIQAMCRDLMARALVACDGAGLSPVLHLHDSITNEVPANAGAEAGEFTRGIMMDLPDWADGFPVDAAGHTGKRYRK